MLIVSVQQKMIELGIFRVEMAFWPSTRQKGFNREVFVQVTLFLKSFWDIIFPPCCPVCNKKIVQFSSSSLCLECYTEIELLTAPFCQICGRDFEKQNGRNTICGECLRHPPAYTFARSVIRYSRQAQVLIHKMKFGKDLSVQTGILDLIDQFNIAQFQEVDFILPVPLHISRLRTRGWNQSLLLAQLFFPCLRPRIKVDWLKRTRNTVAQTTLNGRARRLNLKDSFAVGDKAQFVDSTVCLVDDVFTS